MKKTKNSNGAGAKTSMWLDPATEGIISARNRRHGERSETIRILLGWYDEMVRRARPELADKEWNAIRDAMNGTWLLAEVGSLGMLASGLPLELHDACRLTDLGRKWEIDGPSLVKRLAAMPFAERVAVIDDVVRFWASVGDPEAEK